MIARQHGTRRAVRHVRLPAADADAEADHGLNVSSAPKIKHRHLNYWDTERLYAGNNAAGTGGLNGENGAVFNFAATGASARRNLPVILDRYIVVARALASLGINGITINNVNANNAYLTQRVHRAGGRARRRAAPVRGQARAVDPLHGADRQPVRARHADQRAARSRTAPRSAAGGTARRTRSRPSIPDFIGFTVKANSEGQPGPQDFGDDHGDGANGIGAAVAPLGMKVFWRTFVYNADVDNDRLKRALPRVRLRSTTRSSPTAPRAASPTTCSCRPRTARSTSRRGEPFHPMFGRMENTNQAMELQITQEYTGQSRMLTYLGPMWEEVLKTDTYATNAPAGKRLVGDIVDGTAQGHADTAHRRRREPRQRRQPHRPPLRPGEPVRLRAASRGTGRSAPRTSRATGCG